jgi:hypothetical protein
MDSEKTEGAAMNCRDLPSGVRRHLQFGVHKLSIWCLLCAVCSLPVFAEDVPARDGRWAILISGASGEPALQERYLQEITELHTILKDTLGFSQDRIVVLFDDPSKNPDLIQHQSTRENLEEVCRNLRRQVSSEDLVFVFIEGHGNYDAKTYKLNLVGRGDPTDAELAAMLYSIPAGNFIVVNVTSCSGGSLFALSREGSIVVTATKSGMEKNLTHTGRFFIEAFKDNAADMDKSGRISLVEAFTYTLRNVETFYENEGRLPTEHPMLDDNGDAEAHNDPTPENGEGLLARITYLDAGPAAGAGDNLTPEQQELTLEAQDLERQIEALKYAKGEMQEEVYEKKLEELFLKLARINAKLRDGSQVQKKEE